MLKNALISECGKYRYWLHRSWDDKKKTCMFIMLNPSTADDKQDDPTIRRCINYAKKFGYGSLYVTNLFSYRATKQSDLKKAEDPVGKENDNILLAIAKKADKIIAAWGSTGKLMNRSGIIKNLLNSNGHVIFCLNITKNKEPSHPLYLKKNLELIEL